MAHRRSFARSSRSRGPAEAPVDQPPSPRHYGGVGCASRAGKKRPKRDRTAFYPPIEAGQKLSSGRVRPRCAGTVMTMQAEALDLFAFDNSYARLPDRFFARLAPTPVAAPQLVRVNQALARHLGIDPVRLATPD